MTNYVKNWWAQLTPEMRAWILGALHAIGVAAVNTLVATPFTTWKGMIAIAISSGIGGFKLYRAQSPIPRRVWSDDERTLKLSGK